LSQGEFESVHRGVDTTFINEDPNRLLPVDVMREMEREGIIGRLYPYFFATTGCGTFVEMSRKIGAGIAKELKDAGVEGVILTAT
jgi:glycine reductase